MDSMLFDVSLNFWEAMYSQARETKAKISK